MHRQIPVQNDEESFMSRDHDTKIALFIDFDNVALGARDANQRFDTKILMQRILEKGKILVKKAYADWHFYKEHMGPLHENAIELIEIPTPRISGKNSADIKLVVDAMELCYSKDHIDTFVIVSGDSDFSPLVSKLRENNKRVIGIGVKNSSSHLLINNCDEFIFYDDIYRDAFGQSRRSVGNVPADKREMFEFLVHTVQGLLQESRGVLYSSLIKDTMTRKMPDFNERNFGYSTFGDLLDDSRRRGLLIVERDLQAGGTWVVQGLGDGKPLENEEASASRPPSRRRRRSSGRGRIAAGERVENDEGEQKPEGQNNPAGATGLPNDQLNDQLNDQPNDQSNDQSAGQSKEQPAKQPRRQRVAPQPGVPSPEANKPEEKTSRQPSRKKVSKKVNAQREAPGKVGPKKVPTTKKVIGSKKAFTKKAPTKKVLTKKSPAKKPTIKKGPTSKTPTSQSGPRKPLSQKTPTKKTTTQKTGVKKATTKKIQSRKPQTKNPATKKTGIKKKNR